MRGSILLRTTRCESSCSKAPDIASLSSARGTILLRLLLLLLLHELARVIFILAVPFTPSTVAIHGAWALVSKTLARRLCSTRLDLLPNIAPGRPGTSIYSVGILCDTIGRFALVRKGHRPKDELMLHASPNIRHLLLLPHRHLLALLGSPFAPKVHLLLNIREDWRCRSGV